MGNFCEKKADQRMKPDITIDEHSFATANTDLGRYVLGTVIYLTPNATRAWITEIENMNLDVAAFAHKASIQRAEVDG